MPLTLGYWSCKTIAHPIRQLLVLTGTEFEEVTWDTYPEWFAKKAEVFTEGDPNCPLANNPYLIDGETIITESLAIPFYICHKVNRTDLLGKSILDQTRVRQLEGVGKDLFRTLRDHVFLPDAQEKVKAAAKDGGDVRKVAASLSAYLGDKDYFLGYLTYPDLLIADNLKFVRNGYLSAGVEDPFANFPNLIAHCKRVSALPGLNDIEDVYPFIPEGFAPWYKNHPLPE